MSGALAERDFVEKLERAGFRDMEIIERHPRGIDFLEQFPLFTDDLLDLMRGLLTPEQLKSVAVAVVLRARLA